MNIKGNTSGKYHFTIDGEKFKFYRVSESSMKGDIIGIWSETLFNIKWMEGEIEIKNLKVKKRQYNGHYNNSSPKKKWFLEFVYDNNILSSPVFSKEEDLDSLISEVKKIKEKYRHIEEQRYLEKEKKILVELNKSKNIYILEFDKDGNGELDTVEVKDDFDKLVKKHQPKIIDTDRSYIQHFVKVSNYQKQKRKNLQSIFESISKTMDQKELSSQVELLKEQIHSYELLLFHSLNMVTSLVEDDMFTFYEIYESFDKLEIFNSNHENEVSKRLRNIEGGIGELITSIRHMEDCIIDDL